MSNTVNRVKGKIPESCLARRAKDINLDGYDVPYIIVSMDEVYEGAHKFPRKFTGLKIFQGKRCDLLLISGNGGKRSFVPIERKGRTVDVGEVTEQLKGGVKFAEENALLFPSGVEFIPVLISKGKLHPDTVKKLRKAKLEFRGDQISIKKIGGGQPIKKVLP